MIHTKVSLDRLASVVGILVLAWVPVRLLSLGYLPVDDALRHAGKAMTERSWGDILVVRPEITMDSHPGWHFVLQTLRQATGADAMDLVFASVVGLFLLVALIGFACHQPPWAWLAALVFVAVFDSDVVLRWIMGRPFLFSTAWLLVILFTWERGPILTRHRDVVVWTLVFGLLSWIHPSFYLFALPVIALCAARRLREAGALAAVAVLGSFLGGVLSGHPLDFYRQAILHPLFSLGKNAASLVGEFQPADGSPMMILAALVLLSQLRAGYPNLDALRSDPTLVLVVLGWSLAFLNKRFWVDWGGPALLALITREIARCPDLVFRPALTRFALTLGLSGILALTLCSDRAGRWSRVDRYFAPLARPEQARLLPDPGGVLYSDSMYVFYSVFVRKPDAPFRYVLGFEAGWMKEEDETVYREGLRGGHQALRPWVTRLRPQDRLIVSGNGSAEFPELEWEQATSTLWSGRLPY